MLRLVLAAKGASPAGTCCCALQASAAVNASKQQQQQAGGLLFLGSTTPWLLHRAAGALLPGCQAHLQQELRFSSQPGKRRDAEPPPPRSPAPFRSSSHDDHDLSDSTSESMSFAGSKESSSAADLNGTRPSSSPNKYAGGPPPSAQHKSRRWSAAMTQQQLQQQLQQQQLQQQQAQQLLQLKQKHASQADAGAAEQTPWQRQQQQQQQGGKQPQPLSLQAVMQAPPGQYKIVQYSPGTSMLLSIANEDGGGYSLSKVKGPASAADLAAFGARKPQNDQREQQGQAQGKAGKPPREQLPLLLRPFARQLQHVKKALTATFLPAGYPTSVGSKYLEYTLWQAVTNFATTANGVLASTFMLYSVGLGAGAIPTAGALNWVLKDGLGQMGTLLFGKAIAHNFDIHSKTWYFMSFLLLSTATGLEIATILVPQGFLVLGSCANMIKGLSWMAGGSTRSVFNLSFVRDNNIADITAKNTSQYIFASLFGTAAGVSCCAYIGQTAPLALLCFSGLAYTSMYGAYRTVKAIPLPTLNSTRLQLLAARYLKCVRTSASGAIDGFPSAYLGPESGFMSYQREYEVPEEEDDRCEITLPSPVDMSELDNPLPWVMGDPRILNPGIHVGSQLDRLVEGQPSLLVVVLNTFRYSRYLLVPERNAIHLILHAEAQPRDMVQAYLQACILRKCLKSGQSLSVDNLPELRIVLHDTLLAAEALTPPFMRALQRQGWQTEKIVVEAHRRRARW